MSSRQEAAARDILREWSAGNKEDSGQDGVGSMVSSAPVVDIPQEGHEFALLYVPRFGADYVRPIAEGVDLELVLNNASLGVGHYSESSTLGEAGNFALAGHRTTYGAPFAEIAQLRLGDRLYVEVEEGWFVYRFRNLEYVTPTTVDVLNRFPHDARSKNQEQILTLTSCHPRFSNAERIIAYAVLERWQARSEGAPSEILHLTQEGV